jgi:hypothetical protein
MIRSSGYSSFWVLMGISAEFSAHDAPFRSQGYFCATAKEVLSKEGGESAHALPYQLASVTKEGQWGRDVRFVLEVDGKEVQERTHFVP